MTDASNTTTQEPEDEDGKPIIIGTGSLETARSEIEKYLDLGYELCTFVPAHSTAGHYTWVLTLENDDVDTYASDDDEDSVGCLVIIVAVIVVLVATMGNWWYTNDSALQELRVDNPHVTHIEKTSRNILGNSVLTVRLEDGSLKKYCLDSDILFNYEFSDCK